MHDVIYLRAVYRVYFVLYTTTYSTLKQLELPELTLKAMAALAAVKTQGDVSSLETFAKLAKNCMTFNAGGQVAEVMESVWNACQSAPTSKDTPFSKVFIHTKVAKEFDAVNLSEWVQALDDEMAVACCLAVKELKVWLKEHGGADYLTWDKVVSIFNNCDYIIKDESSSISASMTYKHLTNNVGLISVRATWFERERFLLGSKTCSIKRENSQCLIIRLLSKKGL